LHGKGWVAIMWSLCSIKSKCRVCVRVSKIGLNFMLWEKIKYTEKTTKIWKNLPAGLSFTWYITYQLGDFPKYLRTSKNILTMNIAKETESGVVTAKKVVGKIKYFVKQSLNLCQDAWSTFYLCSTANYTNSRISYVPKSVRNIRMYLQFLYFHRKKKSEENLRELFFLKNILVLSVPFSC
jgi:hypothetical protein